MTCQMCVLIPTSRSSADHTVVFVNVNIAAQAADQLTNSVLQTTEWLKHNCLQLNESKTACMFF